MISLISALILSPAPVAAALYPTSPTSNTVFYPGFAHTALIRWVDDMHIPSVDDLGDMKIELMLANTIVATLALSIPSTYREVKLHLPDGLGPESSDYAVVFVPPAPFPPIYSARFTISNYTAAPRTMIPSATPVSSSSSVFVAVISTETSPAMHPSTLITQPTVTFAPGPGKEKIGTTASGGHRVGVGSPVRFRVLYVLWPVLVGAMLAS